MQLKAFSFISPVIESSEVFKAIGTVIPPDAIAQTIGNTDSLEERVSQAAITTSGMFGDRHESMVIGFNDHSPQKSCQWLESAVDKTGKVLANAEQCLDYARAERELGVG